MAEAKSPNAMRLQKDPRVRAEAGNAIMRLELESLHDRSLVQDIEVFLTPYYAEQLGLELVRAAKKLA
jgi:hypothetical protein